MTWMFPLGEVALLQRVHRLWLVSLPLADHIDCCLPCRWVDGWRYPVMIWSPVAPVSASASSSWRRWRLVRPLLLCLWVSRTGQDVRSLPERGRNMLYTCTRGFVLALWIDGFVLALWMDVVDTHWLSSGPHGGHQDRALAPRGWLLVRFGGVPGWWAHRWLG